MGVGRQTTQCNIVSCKWVFKLKKDANGNGHYKARLVARGFSQKKGIDYDETFARIVRRETFRLLINLAVKLKVNVYHMDVKRAFLNGELHEVVFMKQPKLFVMKGQETKVCYRNQFMV
jgi:hypothetical protein